jgi:hypothetical protein
MTQPHNTKLNKLKKQVLMLFGTGGPQRKMFESNSFNQSKDF